MIKKIIKGNQTLKNSIVPKPHAQKEVSSVIFQKLHASVSYSYNYSNENDEGENPFSHYTMYQ